MNVPCCNFHKRFSRRKVINNILPNLSQKLHIIGNKLTKNNNAIKGLKVLKTMTRIYKAKEFKVRK
jgi:hypothetical protein